MTSRYVQISLWSILWVCSLPVWANSELRQGDKGNYRQMGIMRLQRGDYGGAVQSFQKAIRQHPKEGSLYFELAVTLQRLGRFQESVAPLKRAIALEPDNNTDAYQLLGAACAMEEQWPEAVKALGTARLMWASDYPHFDARFPDAAEIVVNNVRLSDAEKRALLGDNALRFFTRIRS